jgi:YrbI family 3-deoxy-D-manno-octulosonate 8-phosphate phosphatase
MDRRLADSVQLIAFDFDGVLTDNRVLVFSGGEEAVFCNRTDGLAFDAFRASGLRAIILSTERHGVVAARAAKLQVPALQALADKSATLADYCGSNNIDLAHVMFVGNDVNDLRVMQRIGFPIAVADAHPLVKACARIVLKRCGGDGVAREIAEDILALDIAGTEPWKA